MAGQGAILHQLILTKSPEAQLCADAFGYNQSNLAAILRMCDSGVELDQSGFGGNVEHTLQLNLHDAVPVMRNGRFEQFS
jgi:2-phosphosulfolactate phosphatase